MIKIKYKQSPTGDQDVEVMIHSFIVVGSVNYLLEIANFFVPDQSFLREWKKESLEDIPDVLTENPDATNEMTVFVKIDEPDIFLVENIDDSNSEALMLNAEVQFKYEHVPKENATSMTATMSSIRCHTCKFNPKYREETMAQILQPCTVIFFIFLDFLVFLGNFHAQFFFFFRFSGQNYLTRKKFQFANFLN